MEENINNTMKGYFINLGLFFLGLLYIGGSICALVAVLSTKALIPSIATAVVVAFGFPVLLRITKRIINARTK